MQGKVKGYRDYHPAVVAVVSQAKLSPLEHPPLAFAIELATFGPCLTPRGRDEFVVFMLCQPIADYFGFDFRYPVSHCGVRRLVVWISVVAGDVL